MTFKDLWQEKIQMQNPDKIKGMSQKKKFVLGKALVLMDLCESARESYETLKKNGANEEELKIMKEKADWLQLAYDRFVETKELGTVLPGLNEIATNTTKEIYKLLGDVCNFDFLEKTFRFTNSPIAWRLDEKYIDYWFFDQDEFQNLCWNFDMAKKKLNSNFFAQIKALNGDLQLKKEKTENFNWINGLSEERNKELRERCQLRLEKSKTRLLRNKKDFVKQKEEKEKRLKDFLFDRNKTVVAKRLRTKMKSLIPLINAWNALNDELRIKSRRWFLLEGLLKDHLEGIKDHWIQDAMDKLSGEMDEIEFAIQEKFLRIRSQIVRFRPDVFSNKLNFEKKLEDFIRDVLLPLKAELNSDNSSKKEIAKNVLARINQIESVFLSFRREILRKSYEDSLRVMANNLNERAKSVDEAYELIASCTNSSLFEREDILTVCRENGLEEALLNLEKAKGVGKQSQEEGSSVQDKISAVFSRMEELQCTKKSNFKKLNTFLETGCFPAVFANFDKTVKEIKQQANKILARR